ncbi:dc123f32-79b5-44c4-a4a6-c786489bb128 [Thermothielavioides terrestris]|uniref:MPN domain-containing protein n=2 Tax=Thermothielavioides terrestris TaxID=2587410 RepID=G2R8H6_THETT|nr:uncharacterized protein THITE_2117672 [Thermothielavioides terrestris NRRL 8126]AEO68234.1 hypothetical protein THITE_2117672 [Thermothielavioides terrestris NRRL 8126]SPQ24511.1 dc123f32-79b5-44c4-a4a6-c786489bb128 [Thermothielavioides terrestris]
MNSTDLSLGSRPMSAKELTEKAKAFDWNPRIGFKYWARAAETIHHEGQVYLREANIPQAYLVLYRYSVLVLDYLPKHPEAKEPEAKKAVRPLRKRLPRVIGILEALRPDIDEMHQRWVEISKVGASDAPHHIPTSPYARHAANDPALAWNYASPANILDASDYQDLAVDLARKEMRRRRREAASPEEDIARKRPTYLGDKDAANGRHATQYMDDDELRRQMEETRRQLDRAHDYRSREPDDVGDVVQPSTYYYPSISRSSPLHYERPPSRDYERPISRGRVEGPRPLPPRPPKEPRADRSPVRPTPRPRPEREEEYLERSASPLPPPPRPEKEPLPSELLQDLGPGPDGAPVPPPKAPTEVPRPKRITFRPAAYLENGDPIRPVFLPSALRQRFLRIAEDNTRQGLEMCGMLCGTTVNNALFISHLVIPEQRSTSDTCETENESAMLDFCIENDLIVIGWIHTHPTQTCFMSSRDLHTQAGYQVMMPESIAIVCAPRHEPSWGIFRLTNPPGLPHILSCQRTETFHSHSVDNLYVEAGHPQGHVYESKTLEFEVCDLRPGH